MESRVELKGPRPAYLPSGVVVLDMEEWLVRAVFRHEGEPVRTRIEVPGDWVKQAPDHSVPAGASPADVSAVARAVGEDGGTDGT